MKAQSSPSILAKTFILASLLMHLMNHTVYAGDIPDDILTLFYTGQYDSAIVALNQLKQSDSSSVEIDLLLGDAYQKSQRWYDAITCYERVYGAQPAHQSNIIEYASVLQRVGYSKRAQGVLRQALAADSSSSVIMRMLARLDYEEMDYSSASGFYLELLSSDPDNVDDHVMAARCAKKLNEPDLATQHYEAAYSKDPMNNKIVYEYARHLHLQDKNSEVFDLIEQCDMDVQGDQKFIILLGNCSYGIGEYQQAAAYLEQAVAFQPNNVELIKKLGFCYYADKDYSKAYQQFLRSEPYEDDPATYYYLGLCAQELGYKKAAVVYLEKSLSLVGPNYLPHLYFVLGQCHHDLKEFPEAIRSFKDALDVTQDDSMIYYSLANTYNDYYSDKSVALEYYNKALEYDLPAVIETYIRQQVQALQNQIFFSE